MLLSLHIPIGEEGLSEIGKFRRMPVITGTAFGVVHTYPDLEVGLHWTSYDLTLSVSVPALDPGNPILYRPIYSVCRLCRSCDSGKDSTRKEDPCDIMVANRRSTSPVEPKARKACSE